MSARNPEAVITHTDTEGTGAVPPPEDKGAARAHGDVVRRDEFRLLLWMQGFVLTVLVSALAFLYTAVSDLRVELAEQRVEFQVAIADLRADMEAQHADIRGEIADLRERVVRIETLLEIESRTPGSPPHDV